jgi:P-type E1-E2 ATPase
LFLFAGISLGKIANSRTEPGNGVSAIIDGEEIFVGRHEWVSRLAGCATRRSSPSECTEIWIGSQTRGMIGSITLSDSIRNESSSVVDDLIQSGKKVYLLSGDNAVIAGHVGKSIGISQENIFAGKSPEEKARFVTMLQSQGEIIAMVGDGVNDTIALGSADVGIAMGRGADAAGCAADVVLLGDNLMQLTEAMNIGESTMSKIRQNLGLALVYNTVGIPIAAGALLPKYGIMLSPTFAAAMMACSSIIVVGNSLLLKRTYK